MYILLEEWKGGAISVILSLELNLKGLNMADDNQNYKVQTRKWSSFSLSKYWVYYSQRNGGFLKIWLFFFSEFKFIMHSTPSQYMHEMREGINLK